eukprot:CAMPEP_0173239378 /NCGR_PEP_ID=MMETSP1142-20121109/13176_1 /TAXON_ID=483371 /ORGANISM="non described non described, Strain CCMP2298" /LENGTH=318 /DNA_ID=CAMNT_0014170379 /DNA_START=159 /DNA_END=1112 /DNA_ORIENTATION=-
MAFSNRVTTLFGVKYPIIQAGMIWASGGKLAAAVSNAGGLGVIGAGSMYPEVLRAHIRKCKLSTSAPFGVNVPLLVPGVEEYMRIIADEGVQVVFTSAGSPAAWTRTLQAAGIKVVHVVSSSKHAVKAQDAGVDAVVAEGFEAGGHNGIDETTTLCLIPAVKAVMDIPVIAAGGVASGRSMMATMVLGAEGVQIGTRFVATDESSAHDSFKRAVLAAKEGDTHLSMKAVTPVRLLKNPFYQQVIAAEKEGASREELQALLGRGRAKLGMFLGNLEEGELEIGQASALLAGQGGLLPAAEVVAQVWGEFEKLRGDPLAF